jgi:putative spermidine/putrescine transport system permease protein
MSGRSLAVKSQWRRAHRREVLTSLGLMAPLLIFLLVVFVVPLGYVLKQSVDNREVVESLPRTVHAIRQWDGTGVPGEPVYAALVADLMEAGRDRTVIGRAAKRLNYEMPGFRSLLFQTERQVSRLRPPFKEALLGVDARWGTTAHLAAIARNTSKHTDFYLLAALDLKRELDGRVGSAPRDEAIFVDVFARTFWVSTLVTAVCLLLGYPVAYLLATLPARSRSLLMFFVLLPFWTSALVRTTAWLVLLQRNGVVNSFLLRLGLVTEPLPLVFNRIGVVIAMTQVLLPFMILPIYSVMRGIDPQHVRAATSLGARPIVALWKVYLPQTTPGVSAGCAIVLISALGFYVTPAVVGGPRDHMISTFIAHYINVLLSWGHASALAVILLFVTGTLYIACHRLLATDRLRIG